MSVGNPTPGVLPPAGKLEFPNGRGQTLAARLELPPLSAFRPPRAMALFAHCFTCSKDSPAATRISRALGARGFGVLRFDFTGLGGSQGDLANAGFSSNVEDLLAAADFLRDAGHPPRLLLGHSLGGAAVLAAAPDIPEVRGVVTLGSPSEPAHVERLLPEAVREADDPIPIEIGGRTFALGRAFVEDLRTGRVLERVQRMKAALLVLHSPQDTVVGIDHARRIYEAARHPKSFLSLDGADHLLSRRADADYVADVVAAWSSRYLPPAPDAGEGLEEGSVLVVERDRRFTQDIAAGAHTWVADEPRKVGGEDLGPTPYDLLLAALGACTSMTLRMYARHKGLAVESIAVRLRHQRIHAADCETCETESGSIDHIVRELEVEGELSADQRQRLLEIADRCPVHRTLMGPKEIETRYARLSP